MTFGTNAALSSDGPPGAALDAAQTPARALTVLIAVPTIEAGAADEGAVDLAAILAGAGHHPALDSPPQFERWLRRPGDRGGWT